MWTRRIAVQSGCQHHSPAKTKKYLPKKSSTEWPNIPIRMTNFSNTKWEHREHNRNNKRKIWNKKLCCQKWTYCLLLFGNLKYTCCILFGWNFFLCNLRCNTAIHWFWLFIVTRENFVLVYVFDKSRSITSFSSFSIHKISINTLITFFLLTDRQGFSALLPPKIRFVSQSQIYGFHFNQHKLSPRFSFHRSYFFKKYSGSFCSASRHQHTYI